MLASKLLMNKFYFACEISNKSESYKILEKENANILEKLTKQRDSHAKSVGLTLIKRVQYLHQSLQ